jgi:hypothetical protein
MKTCSKCQENKELDQFYSSIRMKDGLDSYCKKCRYAHTKSRGVIERSRRRDRINSDPEYRKKYLQQKRESFIRNIEQVILARTRYRAKLKNIEFDLEKSDIVIPEICPILGCKLIIGVEDNYEYSPSIDRIDNSKGYIKGNIQIISKKANSMKNSATKEELIKFAEWIENKVKI